MIKAIFFDIDGTLLSFKTHKIPESTKLALTKAKEKGIKIFIATGRPKVDILRVKELTEFPFDGFVAVNGQFCYDKDENVLYEKYLDSEDVKNIFAHLKKNNLACHVILKENIYETLINERVKQLAELVGYEEEIEVKPLDYFLDKEIFQLCPYISPGEDEEFNKQLENSRTMRWCDLFVDVIPKDGGKPKGIEKICEHYGIKQDEIMAFGDGENDCQMLEYAKIGVAMGNANEKVKSCADYVTDDIDENGVENALKHFGII